MDGLARIKASFERGGEKIHTELEIGGGYPDFCDSFVTAGSYDSDGEDFTDEEIDYINDNHSDYVYDQVIDYYF